MSETEISEKYELQLPFYYLRLLKGQRQCDRTDRR